MKILKSFLSIVILVLSLSFISIKNNMSEYCGKYKFDQNGKVIISEVSAKNDSTLEIVSPIGAIEVVNTAKDTFEVQSYGGTVIFKRDESDTIDGKIIKALVNIPNANLDIEAIKQD
ncbi:hypothetical protein [Rhizosphaericola mali]|uniref:Uncharacterized protein n=1 Tax=Rhizosphaericola mali TaxID=2545455 RepID=A0A5P2FV77_9BACT|nr:hypothetical protein [Rhizosphaericola mali]QES87384.1 hypothetical protein E0W69_001480 [Rhizosphaericola mali]